MPAKKKKTNGAPRDVNGRYLPRNKWSQADVKRFEKMKRNGELKTGPRKNRAEENPPEENPMVIRRTKSGKEYMDYLEPRDQRGKFVDRSKWSKQERALHEQMRQQGFFARRSLSRKRRIAKRYEKGDTSLAPAPGMKNIERMLQRLEQRMYETDMKDRIQSVLDAIERKDRYVKQITVEQMVPQRYSGECDSNINCTDPFVKKVGECIDVEGVHQAIINRVDKAEACCEDTSKRLPELEKGILEAKALYLKFKQNPRKKSLVTDVSNFAKYHPLLAFAGAGALIFIAYSLYRAITAFLSSRGISLGSGGGVTISHGVMTFGREAPYTITQDDMVWLARGAYSEVNPSNSGWDDAEKQRGAAAVMYSMANHLMTVGQKRQTFQTLGNLVQNYCQPLSPRWASAGAAGCQGSPGNCTESRLAHRAAMRTKQWGTFPAQLERMVQDFSAGTLANPIGRRTGWVAQNSASARHMAQSPQVVAGNLFVIDTNAREATA